MKKALSILTAAVMSCCALSVPTASAAVEYPTYDMNLNGKVDLPDAVILHHYYAVYNLNGGNNDGSISDEVWAKCQADGDLSGDGAVTAHDASLLLGICTEQAVQGDINCDGVVTASDAAMILMHYRIDVIGDVDEYIIEIGNGKLNERIESTLLASVNARGDMDGDGIVTGADAALALKVYTDFQTQVPIE